MSCAVGLAALTVATVLSIPQLAAPAPVAASSSCTGWTSQTVPPRTIRVLRTQTGRVERVPFRRYVAEVMASGEWPSRLHQATLEVGAVATKQYAWYYAMRGHHRPGYLTGSRCYDVRDDTMDQLYRPERAHPSIASSAPSMPPGPLTLRKYGRFFLTGYRAGVSSQCAADANGWKLYARSVEACARQGWSRQRLQRTYLGPTCRSCGPTGSVRILAQPDMVLKRGSRLPDGPVTVSWKPQPVSPGVSRYMLQRRVGRGAGPASPSARRRRARPVSGSRRASPTTFASAVRHHGRLGPWYYSGELTAALRGPVGTQLGVAAWWQPPPAATSVRARFTGRSVALVASTGPAWAACASSSTASGSRSSTCSARRPASANSCGR